MSLHKITAGSGYDYLTRQVAAMDSTEKGHAGLASYYTEKGETPGVWVGSGLAGIDGLAVGDEVTAEQMTSLFGSGHHPLARQRQEALPERGLTEKSWREAARLGQPFKVFDNDISDFRIEVARRLEKLNSANGKPTRAAVAIEDRARIRTQVGREMFRATFHRDPLDERELAGHIAKLSRQQTTAVAGYDLTFSPVKSVSALWALAPAPVAAAIELAHRSAVADALHFIETHALFTRTGTNGVRQVEVNGLVGTAFTHRDSRAGDPDLHTHVAVANKVQTRDGRWLSIDGRVLHKAVVAASETYNTALERHLASNIGVRFEARPQTDPRQRPVREIVGVEASLNQRWSTRRVSIEARRTELTAAFQHDHGRPPTPVESIALAQQATLETRDAKHESRTLAEQRATWFTQAIAVLGSRDAIRQMIDKALHPLRPHAVQQADEQWVRRTAGKVLAHVQAHRSSWQTWHLRAEAHRHIRDLAVPAARVETVVDRLVTEALSLCRPLTKPVADDEPQEPAVLRRSDGASVYSVAGSQLYTSQAILASEARLVAAAGRGDGKRLAPAAVDVALLECEANGTRLNAGQVLLVREMATSGARLQLAIAPAGSGKTTAMSALSRAWSGDGGTVVGLAPSAAAAAGLGEQIAGTADTLAKLVWSLAHPKDGVPKWVRSLGPDTLVIIDEAGMADTLSLDAAVTHILDRGGSVRLIGDDQQLAAIGAGGVLRDIQSTHGALHLSELVRFTDRAEGSASLALREGQTSALGFYLDQHRIHVGDATTMADDLFAAWSADITGGLDSIMLAPTRDLVSELNRRARTQRLNGHVVHRSVQLADGNQASAGDTIITRENNRTLRTSAADWVKNGDRWRIKRVTRRGALKVQHIQSRRTVLLPAKYVTEQVELGYACTTHTAQGVTADTMHGLLTGTESRQHTYTMLTRGREANHAYLVVVGDGDPHSVIRPETVNPLTPTDLLESILARDESPVSATTSLRLASAPTTRLGEAAERYSDAISFAAGHIATPNTIQAMHDVIDAQLPQLTSSETWPILRAQLLLVQADGRDPIQALADACEDPISRHLDPCSVLSWRIADAGWRNQRGPMPWLPAIPAGLREHPLWGPYLAARAGLVDELAEQVRADALSADKPVWGQAIAGTPSANLIADIEVWRAAHKTDPADTRPLGEPVHGLAQLRVQRRLQARLNACQSAALDEWSPLLNRFSPTILADTFAPVLAARLSQMSSAGINTRQLLDHAISAGPLPDDHAAAALWWRLSGKLSPAIAANLDRDHHLATAWLDTFTTLVGDRAAGLQDSPWWPALVATIERGLQRGWNLRQLVDEGVRADLAGHTDPCQGWVWRLSLLTDRSEPGEDEPIHPDQQPPDDLPTDLFPDRDHTPVADPESVGLPDVADLVEPDPDPWTDGPAGTGEMGEMDLDDDAVLTIQGMIRDRMGPPDLTDAQVRAMMERADQIGNSPVPLDRLHLVNRLTADFYTDRLTAGWAAPYLTGRLNTDLAGLERFGAGYAPDSWTALVQHLRRHGITDLEAITAGVAQTASTGRLIDRFRDRAMFPIIHNGQVLGFVGRRNPTVADSDNRGPKYLNTATTPLFAKGDQLFVAGTLHPGTVPVLGEGPMDAIALTLTGDDRYIGVAPLGTSLTENQVQQLHRHGVQPVIATDPDSAGQAAAERDYWLLASYTIDPLHADLSAAGRDPADLVADGHSRQLLQALTTARPLGEQLIDRRLKAPTDASQKILQAVEVLAAQPRARWSAGVEHIAQHAKVPASLVRCALASMVKAWNNDVRRASQQASWQAAKTAREHAGLYETVTSPTQPSGQPLPDNPGIRRDGPGPRW